MLMMRHQQMHVLSSFRSPSFSASLACSRHLPMLCSCFQASASCSPTALHCGGLSTTPKSTTGLEADLRRGRCSWAVVGRRRCSRLFAGRGVMFAVFASVWEILEESGRW
jgi:hypothetical protein